MNSSGWNIADETGLARQRMEVFDRRGGWAQAGRVLIRLVGSALRAEFLEPEARHCTKLGHYAGAAWLDGVRRWMGGATLLLLLIGVAGCKTEPRSEQTTAAYGKDTARVESPQAASAADTNSPSATKAGGTNSPSAEEAARLSKSLVLKEGDVVRISFPAAPNLDTMQQIRQDGKISLKLVGEFLAAGLTPSEMEAALLKRYDKELVTKEVTVTVESSYIIVYLTGAVLRPGKLICDRPTTPLEAVMDAGVDYSKANLKKVVLIRDEKGKRQRIPLNLKAELQGRPSPRIELKASDIIFVPEKFSWF
jgi:polysaccharide export outer membrane protein